MEEVSPNPLRIVSLSIHGLFGMFHHHIPLNTAEHVTLLHGPNGRGKTVLLRMLTALFRGAFADLAKVPYERLVVTLSDGSALSVAQELRTSREGERALNLTVHLTEGPRVESFEVPLGRAAGLSGLDAGARPLAEALLQLGQATPDREASQSIDRLVRTLVQTQARRTVPDWYNQLCARVRVHFVETQRLLAPVPVQEEARNGEERSRLMPTVLENARDLARRIGEVMSRYAAVSQRLDRSFPQRLILASRAGGLEGPELLRRMDELEKRRRRLQHIGLLSEDEAPRVEAMSLDPAQRAVLTLYVTDSEEKLDVYNDIAERIGLLQAIINRKFFAKSVRIDKRRGYVLVGHDGRPLTPEALSSGEQHELVLLYNLLFRVESDALLLLDEPELSLHVAWQTEFLGDLLLIAQKVGFDALVATHSPYIVGDRWDLTVELGAPTP